MSVSSKLTRIAVVLFSLTLFAAYVWHAQVTPNTPPPDPLGVSAADTIALKLQPETAEFEEFINYGSPASSGERPKSDLRIISSKVINQPVFSVRRIRLPWETTRTSWNRRKSDPFTDKPDIRYEGHGINLSGFARE